jgi:hypothetical protein
MHTHTRTHTHTHTDPYTHTLTHTHTHTHSPTHMHHMLSEHLSSLCRCLLIRLTSLIMLRVPHCSRKFPNGIFYSQSPPKCSNTWLYFFFSNPNLITKGIPYLSRLPQCRSYGYAYSNCMIYSDFTYLIHTAVIILKGILKVYLFTPPQS